ncbi:hypothetical protein CISIN_1g042478mg [Citrus sinensis]|uniref:Large ribosomal subunit protein uL11c n=1 Tax=Citrus sinensis TaxID=2711 RepID=A0A067GN87_CITSI|nr:hypothetical protein CISIN_1g042478mg [Citrus sinensis]
MEARKTQLLRILVVILLQHHLQISLTLVGATSNVHIVYMGEKKYEDPVAITKSHHRFLSTVLGSKEAAKHSILYSYKHGFSGFAARLTKTQAEKIAELPGVVQVIPNGILKLHTTRSWEFMGLHYYQSSKNLSTESNMGEGTIIGIIDTGVWPESESFSDKGMGQAPVPPHWKGICQKGEKFNSSNCNRKLIGARWFIKGIMDMINASTNTDEGLAAGLARGGAPLAHLAIYKACWDIGCTDADVLKAFDKAIHDGVDVLSVSIGNEIPLFSYIDQRDSIAIGSFHAIAKGITVVSSAGNDGPVAQTIVNTAPWIITVGATTIDRAFPTAITLGNHQVLWGQSIDIGKVSHGFTGLTYSERIAFDPDSANDCRQGSLNATLAAGKIILCFSRPDTQDIQSAAISVTQAGGVGLIYAQFHTDGLDSCNLIPCIKVNYEVGTQILSYIRRARSPIAKLSSPETVIGDLVSPRVASFSSRGPNSMSPAVLKPDIVAPGVDILSAYPPIGSKDIQGYALLSGTSMSCPHVAGIAALIKSLHRDWSPAAIRSALVTTASQTGTDGMNIFEEGSTRKEADPFDIGGGHVNPNKAMNPGLVYDITVEDYIQFLCFMGHNDASISRLTKSKINCLKNNHLALDLNLPSITIPNLHNNETVTVTRKVTNVGQINSAYEALVEAPYGVNMTVEPEVISFNMTIKILSFRVTFFSNHKVHPVPDAEYRFGSLTWTDDSVDSRFNGFLSIHFNESSKSNQQLSCSLFPSAVNLSSNSNVSLPFYDNKVKPSPLLSSTPRFLTVIAMAPPKPGGKAKAKKVLGLIKLALEAGKATPAPPVGPALGAKGVNIMAFCKDYNARTADKAGYVIPVEITVYDDRSFTFILKTPPASVLLLKAAGVEKGSKDPKQQKVGKITIEQLRAIATEKLPDLNCTSIESAMRIIAGTAANMGIDIDPPVLETKKKEL